jgi:hypothetical protein
MKLTTTTVLWIFMIILSYTSLNAQDHSENSGRPFQTLLPTSVDRVPSIASRLQNLPVVDLLEQKEMQDGRGKLRQKNTTVIPGKGSTGNDTLALLQKNAQLNPSSGPELVFETAVSNSQPTDPAGAVGPNHYLAVTNTAFRIFDKSGTALTPQLAPNPSIFPNGGCCDLTASYDNAADRWVISFLGNGAQIAVSTGPDPVNDGWTVYTYAPVVDYQKLSVWHDGYYMTDNANGTFHVYERKLMLQGDPNAQLVSFSLPGWQSDGFDAPQFLNLSHNAAVSGPATMVHMADDSWASVTQDDHLKLWSVTMDWTNTNNSLVSTPLRLGVDAAGVADGTITPFISTFDGGAFNNLTQPGGQDIDALQWIIMNQAQFRKFPTHNSAIFNFVVDTDGGPGELAGIRWYELRQTGEGQPWTVYQEGTYIAPDGRHAWNASMIMDVQGNIGMGYTSMSGPTTPNIVRVGSYYTGQLAAASGTGIMDVAEQVIMTGDANIPGSERYGDYSKIDIDPSNDKKFWFVNELMRNGRKNVCGVFQLAPNTNNDVGVISLDAPSDGNLTAAESISVTVFNFGENDASGFDVTYQVEGGAIVSEPFTGTLASGTSALFTFSTTEDFSTDGQTYSVSACTNYTIDEDNLNDCITDTITHLLSDDLSITAISSPVSGVTLGDESVTVTIENFGLADQSGFDVTYSINGTNLVTETVADVVPAGGAMTYTFTQTADLSAIAQTYTIQACTALANDQDNTNDCFSASITNELCQPLSDCTNGDGLKKLLLGTINIDPVQCTNGYEDYTDQITDLDRAIGSNTHNGILQTGFIAEQHFSMWIDFNDNGDFTDFGEQVLDTFIVPFGPANTDQAFSITIPNDANLGTHILRIRGFRPDSNSILNNPCDDLIFGNTVDMSVNIIDTLLSVSDFEFDNSDLSIVSKPNNQFEIILAVSETEDLTFNVFNMLGQQLLYDVVSNKDGRYIYHLDMSYASSGTYIVKIGRGTSYKTGKLIVR